MQQKIRLKPRQRGFHLITDEVIQQLPELEKLRIGIAHLFLQHTSASLSINENADPTVRADLERFVNVMVPDGAVYFRHTLEGEDDMPAHVKCSMLGCGLMIPVARGRLLLGTWQGIYLGEHRDEGGSRNLIATLQGEP